MKRSIADDERILRLAAACHSNQEIADTLAMDVGDIANRKREAMQKIDVASRVQLLEYALARGWRERPQGRWIDGEWRANQHFAAISPPDSSTLHGYTSGVSTLRPKRRLNCSVRVGRSLSLAPGISGRGLLLVRQVGTGPLSAGCSQLNQRPISNSQLPIRSLRRVCLGSWKLGVGS